MHNPERYVYYDSSCDEEGGKNGLGCFAWIAIAIAVILVISMFSFMGSCVSTYNNLIDMDENVNLEFSNVQAAMQSRLEKIPDLVKVADEAADHIETLIGNVTSARAELGKCDTPEELDAANAEITNTLNQILVIMEEYPTITASEQYTRLMDQIEGASNRILVAREDYNEAVSEYNRTVRKFPGTILAKIFGFEPKDEFVADEAANNSSLVEFGN